MDLYLSVTVPKIGKKNDKVSVSYDRGLDLLAQRKAQAVTPFTIKRFAGKGRDLTSKTRS